MPDNINTDNVAMAAPTLPNSFIRAMSSTIFKTPTVTEISKLILTLPKDAIIFPAGILKVDVTKYPTDNIINNGTASKYSLPKQILIINFEKNIKNIAIIKLSPPLKSNKFL